MPGALVTKQAEKHLNGSRLSQLAGKPVPKEMLVDLERLQKEYFEREPELEDANQLVAFGTSGRHRYHTFSQSSRRRWFQVQPAARRSRGYRGRALDTGSGQRSVASRQSRSKTNCLREGNQITFHSPAKFRTALCERSEECRRFGFYS
jgi:hypothetical protein